MSARNVIKPKASEKRHSEYAPSLFPLERDGVIYVRQSSKGQVLNNIHSFEMQTDKFLEHFRTMGCTGNIEIVADDEAMSGTLDIHERPGLSRITQMISAESIGWVAAVHVNRFFRDQWLINPGYFMRECFRHNVVVATLRMNFDFRDEYCQRVFMLEAEEAARHLAWMKLVLNGGKNTASENGYYDGRWIVPGYIVDRTDPRRKRYIIYLPHAEVVFWLFDRFFELDGNFPALCREVERMPYLFPKFEEWIDQKTVSKFRLKPIQEGAFAGCYKPKVDGLESILTNPVYIGWWLPANGGVVKDNHAPIVSEELFFYARRRLATHTLDGERQKPERISRNGRVPALLKKVIRDDLDNVVYPMHDEVNMYRSIIIGDYAQFHRFAVPIARIDAPFLEKFFEHLRNWEGCEDWEDKLEERVKAQQSREGTILNLIDQAQRQWQEAMATLKDPNIPKTTQMKIDLAKTCEGLEWKITELQSQLAPVPQDEEEEDEKIQYEIYTLLPDLIDEWENLPFEQRLRFIGALTRKVVLSHVSPGWTKMEIQWKRSDWQFDVAHLRRPANHSPWTPEEEAIVREHYPRGDAGEIMRLLPMRPWNTIKARASILGVRRDLSEGRKHHSVSIPNGCYPCLADIEYAREHGLVLSDKKAQWSRRFLCPVTRSMW